MNKCFLFLILFILTICVPAQTKNDTFDRKANFNGDWFFDAKSSLLNDTDKENYKNYTLNISYLEPQITIKRTASETKTGKSTNLVLYTDGRGETNFPYFARPGVKVESKTTWKDNFIIRKYFEKRNYENSAVNEKRIAKTYTTEKYSLTNNQKKLVLTISSKTEVVGEGNGVIISIIGTIKLVFKKIE